MFFWLPLVLQTWIKMRDGGCSTNVHEWAFQDMRKIIFWKIYLGAHRSRPVCQFLHLAKWMCKSGKQSYVLCFRNPLFEVQNLYLMRRMILQTIYNKSLGAIWLHEKSRKFDFRPQFLEIKTLCIDLTLNGPYLFIKVPADSDVVNGYIKTCL